MTTTFCADSPSDEVTRELGERLATVLRGGDVIALEGPLGVGKTCLVQGIARGLGVDPAIPVTSPTFTLIGEYEGRFPLRHVDFYRVESSARLDDAGFEDLFDGAGVVVVEWADRFPSSLPAERLLIQIEFRGESTRSLRVRGLGAGGEELCRRVEAVWR